MPGHKSTECGKPKVHTQNYTNKKWCKTCKVDTHTSRTCRKNKDVTNQVSLKEVNHNDNKHTFVFGTFDVKEDEIISQLNSEAILVDCGATAHIINDESKFIHIDETFDPEDHFIELADGTRCNNVAKKKGTAVIYIQDEDGKLCKSSLNNTLFIPSYPQNIFSVRAAAENGANIQLRADSGELVSSDGTKFPIRTIGKLYYLNMCKSLNKRVRSSTLQE